MPSLRLCFFNRTYPPEPGATGQLLSELAEDLVRVYGCRVVVVTAWPRHGNVAGSRGWLLGRERHQGVEVIRAWSTRFDSRRFAGRAANYLSYFFSACLAAVRVPRAEIVVALTDPPIIGLAALLAARRHRARFVFVCQDVFPEVARLVQDFRSEWVNHWLDRVNRFLLRKADRVVALGETMRARLVKEKRATPRKVVVIHNWADCAAIVPGPKRNRFSEAHGLAERFVVMHSGNVGLSQGLETLLEAAEHLRDTPEALVAVVGDGAAREALVVRANGLPNVRFFPYQPKETLRDSFSSADAFVVSLRPGLAGYIVPSKLYGVLAAGRPYVAAVEEASEVAAITKQYHCGLLARPGDAADLAEKIRSLYRDPALARRLGANARQAALAFDRPKQVAAYYELFRQVAAGTALREPRLKRTFDVILAGLGLLLSAPLGALIALLIKLEDGGPVFYGQERVGQNGRRFRSWKFRSMVPDVDRAGRPRQARRGDARVTRVGRLLRATALDELPQLWNILVGEMSFVGPRALLPAEIEVRGSSAAVRLEQIPGYAERHLVRPGLTGLAQVYADRDIPRRQKFRLDRLYIEKQSFGLDLKLILLSFWITFCARWEMCGRKV